MDIIEDMRIPMVVHEGEEYIEMDQLLAKSNYMKLRDIGLDAFAIQWNIFKHIDCEGFEEEYQNEH